MSDLKIALPEISPREMWKGVWRLQRQSDKGELRNIDVIKGYNIASNRGQAWLYFKMVNRATHIQFKRDVGAGVLSLRARLYIKKLKAAENLVFAPDLSCADCSWSGKYEEVRNAMCPECESSKLFDSAIPF